MAAGAQAGPTNAHIRLHSITRVCHALSHTLLLPGAHHVPRRKWTKGAAGVQTQEGREFLGSLNVRVWFATFPHPHFTDGKTVAGSRHWPKSHEWSRAKIVKWPGQALALRDGRYEGQAEPVDPVGLSSSQSWDCGSYRGGRWEMDAR